MSDLPCFLFTYRGVQLAFSRVEDCDLLQYVGLEVNWAYFRAHVAFKDPRTCETAIEGVSSLEIGQCVRLGRGSIERYFYWHPCEVANAPPLLPLSTAIRTFRGAIRSSVSAWASSQSSIVHRLSGGVDSSIVLACLRDVRGSVRITALNCHSPGAEGDERIFARAVAERCGFELVERERDPLKDFRIFNTVHRTSRPIRDFSAYESHAPEARLARERGATAIFCGSLGDVLFEHAMQEYAGTDYLWRHGIDSELIRVALAAARRGSVSIWRILGLAMRDTYLEPPVSGWCQHLNVRSWGPQRIVVDRRLISTEALEDATRNIDRFTHPWLSSIQGVSPGKLWIIALLTAEMLYESPFSEVSDTPVMTPLCSQPLVEVCLRIPTYLNVSYGMDRAVARLAFADDLPPIVLNQNSKGGPGVWARLVIGRNLDFAREFLLDGIMVRERILDRGKVERALANQPSNSTFHEAEVIWQMYNEAWLRSWSALGTRAIAA